LRERQISRDRSEGDRESFHRRELQSSRQWPCVPPKVVEPAERELKKKVIEEDV
jgi:hypothetical protein